MSFNYNKNKLRKWESVLIFALLIDNIDRIPYEIELEM